MVRGGKGDTTLIFLSLPSPSFVFLVHPSIHPLRPSRPFLQIIRLGIHLESVNIVSEESCAGKDAAKFHAVALLQRDCYLCGADTTQGEARLKQQTPEHGALNKLLPNQLRIDAIGQD